MRDLEEKCWQDIQEQYPDSAYGEAPIEQLLQMEMEKSDCKWIVLDDDPTGVQTVHDVCVYTDWTTESIRDGFHRPERVFFILTNSRAMTESQTTAAHHEIGERIAYVARELGKNYLIISRGDSTLRGHYPLETSILREEMEKSSGQSIDGEILIPFFRAGGRFTIEDVHYVKYGDSLVPAAETEFAQDKTFGYRHSDLKEYIQEKTKGQYPAKKVISISLEELRKGKIEEITDKLLQTKDFGKVIVNAVCSSDLKVFCIALYRAMAKGKKFVFRTAADFVKEVTGVTDKEPLKAEELIFKSNPNGGIIVVGSYTDKTTRQLKELLTMPDLEPIEFCSELVLQNKLDEEVQRVNALCDKIIAQGQTVVVYTRRTPLALGEASKEDVLVQSVKISDGVQQLVGNLTVEPSFVVAKGGITSSDVGVKALKVKRAMVAGQILPGIPVWKTGAESRFPDIPYVIFPGNVGDEQALRQIVEKLENGRRRGGNE